ncbi:MAG: metallophosphoesterase [Candidatus Moranbacteria bacterium]|nr:metallophosphoesterase [Candidatus Moranbacteria bacterium]
MRKARWGLIVVGVVVIAGVAWWCFDVFFMDKYFPATPTLFKIGFVNDWEYDERKRMKHKLTNRAPVELRTAVDFLNKEFQPDVVVGGGDYIESSNVKKEKAKRYLREINTIFRDIQAERFYALGNHDMRSLTKSEVREILGMEENHIMRDIGDWRIIVLDTNFNKEDDSDRAEKNYVVGYVARSELEWLRKNLDTDRPVIVFSHHAPVSFIGEKGQLVQNILNEESVRTVLEERGNVVAVVSGHSPLSYHERRNGIHYFIVDTLVNEPALGSFATIELTYMPSTSKFRPISCASIALSQKGIHPQEYEKRWCFNERDNEEPRTSFASVSIEAAEAGEEENEESAPQK